MKINIKEVKRIEKRKRTEKKIKRKKTKTIKRTVFSIDQNTIKTVDLFLNVKNIFVSILKCVLHFILSR